MSPNYLAVSRGVRELHHLTISGRDESPEADVVRDAIDSPWAALTDVEEKRARGLSEDLHSISDPPEDGPQRMDPIAFGKLGEVMVACHRGEGDRALELLREWRKQVTPALVSYLRGTIWLEAGDPETATLFYEHATDLEPHLDGRSLAEPLRMLGLDIDQNDLGSSIDSDTGFRGPLKDGDPFDDRLTST